MNPYSLLAVAIPSPTLSYTAAGDEFPQLQPEQHDVYGIGISNESISLPVSHTHDRGVDAWNWPTRPELPVTRSIHSEQQEMSRKKATVKLPRRIELKSTKPRVEPKHVFTPPPAYIPRVPSPLMYHKRTNAIFTDSTADVDPLTIARKPKMDQAKHDQLMSEIRSVKQAQTVGTDSESKPWNVARLPCMTEAAVSSRDSEDGGVLLNNTAAPCVKTKRCLEVSKCTNASRKSNRIYHIFSHGKGAHSGFAFGQEQKSCTNINFIFPKLMFSDVASNFGALKSNSLLGQASLPENLHQWFGSSVNSDKLTLESPQLLADNRERSSTQDSFNSRFDVATVIKAPPTESSTLSLSRSDITPLNIAVTEQDQMQAKQETTSRESDDDDLYFDATMFDLPTVSTKSTNGPAEVSAPWNDELEQAFLSESDQHDHDPFDEFAYLLLSNSDMQEWNWNDDEEWEVDLGILYGPRTT